MAAWTPQRALSSPTFFTRQLFLILKVCFRSFLFPISRRLVFFLVAVAMAAICIFGRRRGSRELQFLVGFRGEVMVARYPRIQCAIRFPFGVEVQDLRASISRIKKSRRGLQLFEVQLVLCDKTRSTSSAQLRFGLTAVPMNSSYYAIIEEFDQETKLFEQ